MKCQFKRGTDAISMTEIVSYQASIGGLLPGCSRRVCGWNAQRA